VRLYSRMWVGANSSYRNRSQPVGNKGRTQMPLRVGRPFYSIHSSQGSLHGTPNSVTGVHRNYDRHGATCPLDGKGPTSRCHMSYVKQRDEERSAAVLVSRKFPKSESSSTGGAAPLAVEGCRSQALLGLAKMSNDAIQWG
jgi:hypothetical protein